MNDDEVLWLSPTSAIGLVWKAHTLSQHDIHILLLRLVFQNLLFFQISPFIILVQFISLLTEAGSLY